MVTELGNPLKTLRGMFYGWWLAVIAALVMSVAIVPMFQGLTAWFVVLKQQFSWSSGQISWAFAVMRAEGGLLGPLEGMLVDRLGARRMVLIGLPVLGVGFLLFSRVQELWQLYAAFVIMSFGIGLGTWLPMLTVLNSWFARKRGRAISVAWGGWFAGGILLVPALAWAIDPDADRFGWRATAAALGFMLILLAFPISRLVRNRPEEYGQLPDGDKLDPPLAAADRIESRPSTAEIGGYTWREAVSTRAFWFISIGHASVAIVINTVTVHLGIMLEDRGFSLQTIAWVVATSQFAAVVFTFVGGYVGDRVPIRYAIFGFAALQSVAVIVVILAHEARMAFLFAVILGIGFGGRNTLTNTIRAVYFGRRAFASITGLSQVPMNILQLAAPLFAGYMFDITHSYTVPFATVAVVNFLGCCLFLLLGEPAPPAAPTRAARGTGE